MAGVRFSNPNNNPLRDKEGRMRTNSLFYEYRVEGLDPVWTLKDYDHEGYPSLKLIYMSYDHIPGFEYDFAMETLNSWDHWVKLTNSGLRAHFAEWREELDVRLRCRAIKTIINTTLEGGAAGANAAKYLAEKGYVSKRGRPSKEELVRERRIEAGVEKDLSDDLERVGLKIVSK